MRLQSVHDPSEADDVEKLVEQLHEENADDDEVKEEVVNLVGMPAWQRFGHRVVIHPDFETLVLVFVIVDCIALSLFQPMQPDSAFLNMLMTRTGAHC